MAIHAFDFSKFLVLQGVENTWVAPSLSLAMRFGATSRNDDKHFLAELCKL
ncbi:MAG: hypothetical protein K2Y18_05170 [Alphaproteobacteria bacterium]|nr:hypothetical protein [Alphaproteobacteria bacterium]